MAKYAATTEVSEEKSRMEIETILRRYGANAFSYGWEEHKAIIAFRAHERQVRFEIKMPFRTDRDITHYIDRHGYEKQRSDSAIETEYNQQRRQRWRALALVIKAKLEAVDAEISVFEEEFLANIVLPDGSPSDPRWWDLYIPEMGISKRVKCPYVVGDRLWVRETWLDGLSGRTEEEKASREDVSYRADGEAWEQFEDHMDAKWQPPIFMPRWASRITLEVTDVRAERLQGISQKDAAAEGFVGEMYCPSPEMCLDIDRCNFDAELHFKKAWDKINGKRYPWASNPWVWVIAFRRVEK